MDFSAYGSRLTAHVLRLMNALPTVISPCPPLSLSLRGVKRRGNPIQRRYSLGLLRLVPSEAKESPAFAMTGEVPVSVSFFMED